VLAILLFAIAATPCCHGIFRRSVL
jgi:hypothetical protein